jgi:uncharacterized protein YraI
MTKKIIALSALAGLLALPSAALAQSAIVTTDLNVRLGPGPTYEVMTVIPGSETVTIHGCLETMAWCEVSFGTHTGWVYADYLAYEVEGSPVIIREAATQVEVPVAIEAESGEEAVELCERVQVDIALLDMHMRLLTGLQTLRILKSINALAPCILITADATERACRQAREAGASGVLLKPIDMPELLEHLRQLDLLKS